MKAPKNWAPSPWSPTAPVTTQGKAYRQPKQKLDFYPAGQWLLKDQVPPNNNAL